MGGSKVMAVGLMCRSRRRSKFSVLRSGAKGLVRYGVNLEMLCSAMALPVWHEPKVFGVAAVPSGI